MITRSHGDFIPSSFLRWAFVAKLAKMLEQVRADMVSDPKMLGLTLLFQSGVFVLDATTLWFSLRALGTNVGPAPPFLAFVLGSVVATLSPLPLGLGSFEGSCVAILHLLGVRIEAALAATLIFRAFSFRLPMMPGLWLIRHENTAE